MVERIRADRGPFVWIDDHVDAMHDVIGDAFDGHPHLLISPDPFVGLTPKKLAVVEGFLNEFTR